MLGKSGRPAPCGIEHQAMPAFANTFPLYAIGIAYRMRNIKVILFSVAIVLWSCGFELTQIEYDSHSFNLLASEILANEKIFSMDDFSRYHKLINGIAVKIDNVEGDSSASPLRIVQTKLGLDSAVVEKLRSQLAATKLRDFYRSGDTILFTVDGMLDTSWGFFYSRQSLRQDTSWFNFGDNSIKFVGDVNANWKKVAIK
jgi:hypothetical protein